MRRPAMTISVLRIEDFGALTSMPRTLRKQQPKMRLVYRICPFRTYGQPNFATSAGAILQNAMIPFGVDGGTRSKAADRMIT